MGSSVCVLRCPCVIPWHLRRHGFSFVTQSMARRRPLPAQVRRDAFCRLALCVSRHTLVLSTSIFWVDIPVWHEFSVRHMFWKICPRVTHSFLPLHRMVPTVVVFCFYTVVHKEYRRFFSLPGHHETMRSHVVEGRRCAGAGLLQRDLELRLELPGVGCRCKGYAQDT